MLASIDEQAKLDAALDAALDDLADSDDEDQQHACSTPQISDSGCAQECHSTPRFIGPPRPPDSYSTSSSSPLEGWSPDKLFESMMQQMLEGADHRGSTDEDPFIGQLMKDVQNQLQEDLQSSNNSPNNSSKSQKPASKAKASLTTGKECSTRQRSNTSAESPNSDKVELEAAISDLVKGFSKQASVAESGVANHETLPNGSGAEENFLLSLMHSLSSAGLVDNNNNNQSDGADFNPDKVIDGMMEHLLSKELMYDPMKQVASKFPLWLKDRQSTLSVEEYELRRSQCDCFCRLVKVYETDPNNITKLMELMQEVQEYGQPPAEIIQEIAPGIELDSDGMPKFDASKMPFDGNDECLIM